MQGKILRGRLPTEGSLQGNLSGENNLSGALLALLIILKIR